MVLSEEGKTTIVNYVKEIAAFASFPKKHDCTLFFEKTLDLLSQNVKNKPAHLQILTHQRHPDMLTLIDRC